MSSINGLTFYNMVLSGLNNLNNYEKDINAMNVFPVADGDTGTNMLATIKSGYLFAEKEKNLGLYLNKLSKGMLLGARGNSGVILSQIFKGMAYVLRGCAVSNPHEMANALIGGYKQAYRAVLKPVEGTILTVARLGIENIKRKVRGRLTMAGFFKMYLDELMKQLEETPNYLPILKDANVLDSGGYGYIKIIEGMYLSLINQSVEPKESVVLSDEYRVGEAGVAHIKSQYCVNALLQLMESKFLLKKLDLAKLKKDLQNFCEHSNIIMDGSNLRIIIYTDEVNKVIDLLKQYGEFVSINVENLSVKKEHVIINEQSRKLPFKRLYIVATSSSPDMDEVLKSHGVDIIVRGNKSYSPSTSDYINALKNIEAERVAVFANDINFIETIRLAIDYLKLNNVSLIDTVDEMQCYYDLMMDVIEDTSDSRIKAFYQNHLDINYINVYKASKAFTSNDFSCVEGDVIATINGLLKVASSSYMDTLKSSFSLIDEFEDKAGLFVVINSKIKEVVQEELEEYLSNEYPFIEVDYHIDNDTLIDIKVGVF